MDFSDVFEQAPVPILIVLQGRIAHCNQAAIEVLRFLGFEVSKERLGELDSLMAVILEEREEAERNIELILGSGQVIRNIPRTLRDVSGNRVAALVSAGPCTWEGQAAVAVSFVLLGLGPAIASPDRGELPDRRAGLLQGLTPQEARVARLLAEGHDTAGLRRLLGIQTSTLRGYIKSIYRKLEVHSRSDLVRRVLGHR